MSDTFKGTAVGLIVVGNNSESQSMFAVSNKWGSFVDVDIRRMVVQNDILNSVANDPIPLVRAYRVSSDNIVGGLVLEKGIFDTTITSSEYVEARSNVQISSSTVPPTEIQQWTQELSQVTGSNVLWQQYTFRMHTLVGQVTSWDNPMLPTLVENTNFILHPGESLLVELQTTLGAINSPDRTNMWVQVMWEEVPTTSSFIYRISGITKDSASVALGECDVYLMRKLGNGSVEYVTKSISDSVTGAYSFVTNPNLSPYFVVARKEGTPNVFDVTDFTLTPVNT